MKNIIYGVNAPALYANTSIIGGGESGQSQIIPSFEMIYTEDSKTIELDFTPKALIVHSSYGNGGRKYIDCRSFITDDSSSGLYYEDSSLFYNKLPAGVDLRIYRDGSRNSDKRINIIKNGIRIENINSTILDVTISIQVFG